MSSSIDNFLEKGHSKDHRPDLNQMVIGAVLDVEGKPICCEMWPGNTADVKTLIPVVDRIRKRFHIGRFCMVADRGIISEETMKELDQESVSIVNGVSPPRLHPLPSDSASICTRVHNASWQSDDSHL